MMEEPQPLAPALSSLKTAAPATPSKSVNFKISPVSPYRGGRENTMDRACRLKSFLLKLS